LNICNGLTYNLNTSLQNQQVNENIYYGIESGIAQNMNGEAIRSAYTNTKKLLETYLTYDKTFDVHGMKILGGYSWQQDRNGDGFQTSTYNFLSDYLSYNNLAMGNPSSGYVPNYGSTNIQTLRMISFYGRLNYQYDNRYLLQATVRRDGSSAFGKNNRWGTFPSISLGWNITNESFLKDNDKINELKLRAGYGISGNSLGFDPLIATLRYGTTGKFYYNGQYINAIGPTQNENPDLKWERTAMTNIGLDFSILNRRISGTV
jgi:TonB-dependent starch-binding outer membrane protein SusC